MPKLELQSSFRALTDDDQIGHVLMPSCIIERSLLFDLHEAFDDRWSDSFVPSIPSTSNTGQSTLEVVRCLHRLWRRGCALAYRRPKNDSDSSDGSHGRRIIGSIVAEPTVAENTLTETDEEWM